MFRSKDFEVLHEYKIRNTLEDYEIPAQYFFCVGNKMLFIKKARRYYKVMASCQCGFEPAYRERCLDVLYDSTNLEDVINMFKSYCLRLL